jgi:hypothetical protein
MDTYQLHPSGFLEFSNSPDGTNLGCVGPTLMREQPSRETAGVLLSELSSKYISNDAMNLPYRNSVRTLRDLKTNWSRLSDDNKREVLEIVGLENICPAQGPQGPQGLQGPTQINQTPAPVVQNSLFNSNSGSGSFFDNVRNSLIKLFGPTK